MKILNKLFIVFIVGALLLSCNDEWNDHFESVSSSDLGTNDNLYGYLSDNEEYSKYKELVDEVGLSDLFTGKLEKTLFLPSNDVFNYDSKLDSLGKVRLVTNYLVAGAKYSNALDAPTIRAYSGKWLHLDVANEKRTVNGAEFSYTTKVSNGLIYKLNENYGPVPNLYEYILALPNEYSKIRDYVLDANDTLFNQGSSKPIGINSVGETIYDSVFVIVNSFISGANNVRDEESKFTLFLPNDEVITRAVDKVDNDFLLAVGEKLSEDALANLERWCITAIFHRHLIDYVDFSKEQDIILTDGSLYKIADGLQELDPNYARCSNGRSYNVTNLHIPKLKYLPIVEFKMYEVPDVHYAKLQSDYMVVGEHSSWGDYSRNTQNGCFWCAPRYEWPNKLAFKTWKMVDGELLDATILPGEYDVTMCVSSSIWSLYDRVGDHTISFGSVLPEYADERTLLLDRPSIWPIGGGGGGPGADQFYTKDGDFAGRFVIPDKYGANQLMIHIDVTEKNGRTQWIGEAFLSFIRFTPTTNNY